MQIKFFNLSLLALVVASISLGCDGGEKKAMDEALEIYNSSMAVAENMTARLSTTTNNLKILDSRVRNTDTTAVMALGQAYDDIENVKQLIRQWRRDVPRVSADGSNTADMPVEELVAKQREFKEKVEYIRLRLDDLDKVLKDVGDSLN